MKRKRTIASDIYEKMADLEREVDRIRRLFGNHSAIFEYKQMLESLLSKSSSGNAVTRAREQIEAMKKKIQLPGNLVDIVQEYTETFLRLHDLDTAFQGAAPSAVMSFKKFEHQLREISEMQDRFARQWRAELLEPAILPVERLAKALAGIRAFRETYKPPATIIQAAFQMPIAYQDFVYHQLKRAEKDSDELRVRRTLVTGFSGDLMQASQSLAGKGMVISSGLMTPEAGPWRVLPTNVFSTLNQHVAYLYNPRRSDDVRLAVEQCLPAQINSGGCAIGELIYRINEFSQRQAGVPVFKPTNKLMYAFVVIPNRVVLEERDFRDVVDHLYFLLYEGSGNAERLTALLTNEELDLLWDLKALRLGFSHDVEHGKDREIARKFRRVGSAYRKLIGKPVAVTVSDWKKAQLTLYERVFKMLQLMREKQES